MNSRSVLSSRFSRAMGTAAASAAVFALAACNSAGSDQITETDGRYDVAVVQSVDTLAFLPIYVARVQGYFEDHGVNLEVTVGGTGGTEIRSLVSGEVPMAFSAGAELVKINASGRDVVGVAAINDNSVLTALADREVAEAAGFDEDWTLEERLSLLEGSRIAVTAPGSLTDLSARVWAQTAGLSESDVEFIGAGTGAQQVAAMETGRADIIASFSPFTEQLQASGRTVTLWDQRQGEMDMFSPWLEQVVVTTPEFIEDNPEVVDAVVSAVVDALDWIQNHSALEIAELISELEFFSGTEVDVLAEQIEANLSTFSLTGEISADGVDNVVSVLRSAGAIEGEVHVDEVIDNSFIE